MADLVRLREAAEEHLRVLETFGKTRAEAARELASLATSLAAEGNTDWARVLMSVCEHHRENAVLDQPKVEAMKLAFSDFEDNSLKFASAASGHGNTSLTLPTCTTNRISGRGGRRVPVSCCPTYQGRPRRL